MLTDKQRAALIASGVFNPEWYKEEYPEVVELGLDPLDHFLRLGLRMGRDPGPDFRVQEYLDRHPHLKGQGCHPIVHYLQDTTEKVTPLFSVIMPTKDRAHCIREAIESLLEQEEQSFELIIVDDGSSDGTEDLIRGTYARQLHTGQIVYVPNRQSQGVCMARNIGLSVASGNWMAYLDSDNTVRRNFLSDAAGAIAKHPSAKTFYGNFLIREKNKVGGRPFDLKTLRAKNFIDIGVFFHHRDCYKQLGGFDPHLRRLVDWDLILRYTTHFPPVYIKSILMDYDDPDTAERISRGESYSRANVQVHRKHRVHDTVSVAVLTYNQENYIKQAIESALDQKGDLTVEILISDDGSTDKTPEIVAEYARRKPNQIRLIGSPFNMGISENFRRCFAEAEGEFCAVLEGDDYWISDRNLEQRVAFLRENPQCSMVFNKTKMRFKDKPDGTPDIRDLERQDNLSRHLLTGQDFINDRFMNLIVNFSSCMFKTDLVQNMPYNIYHYRLSEIAVAFWLERHGPIGYLNLPLSVYRHHDSGTWSGLDRNRKLESAIAVRQIVKEVADPKYRPHIEDAIDRTRKLMAQSS